MFKTLKTTLVLRIKLGDDHVVCSSTGGLVILKGIELYAYYVPDIPLTTHSPPPSFCATYPFKFPPPTPEVTTPAQKVEKRYSGLHFASLLGA